MKTNNEMQSFETKIRKSFIRYARIPFVILVTLIIIFITYDQLLQPIIFSKTTQNTIEKKMSYISDNLYKFLDEITEVENNEDFYSDFYKFSATYGIKGSVIIYDENKKVTYITQPSIEGSMYNRVYNRAFLERINKNPNKLSITSANLDTLNNDFNVLMLGYSKVNKAGELISLIYYLNPDVIQNLVQHHSVNHVIITDSNNYVVGTTSQVFVGKINRFYNLDDNLNVKADYKVYSKKIIDDSINIHTLLIKKPVLEQYGLIITLASIVLFGYRKANKMVAERVGKEAAESINSLIAVVDKIKKGDLTAKVYINTNDELELLGDELNIMTTQLASLINRNHQLLELRKNAQIKQLEAQFNPHFLYNSLETIRYLIELDPIKAQKMIINVTKLLRYSIDGNEKMVTFDKDLEYLRLYLNINKIRLGERFNYTIDVSDDILSVVMPKLMIQPIIENSIKHGYRDSDHMSLEIIGYEEDNYIYIKVIDDGSGMSPDTLDSIKLMIKNNSGVSDSYGLHSIIKRLNLIYGKNSEINIESNTNGTLVLLKIPKTLNKG